MIIAKIVEYEARCPELRALFGPVQDKPVVTALIERVPVYEITEVMP